MKRESYRSIIAEQMVRTVWEVQNTIDCIPDSMWNRFYGNKPMWQYVYLMLSELELGFVSSNDAAYQAKIPNQVMTRSEMKDCLQELKRELSIYLSELHDEDLLQNTAGSRQTNLSLILTQFRHLNLRLGTIMGFVERGTGLRPRTLYPGENLPKGNYEPYC